MQEPDPKPYPLQMMDHPVGIPSSYRFLCYLFWQQHTLQLSEHTDSLINWLPIWKKIFLSVIADCPCLIMYYRFPLGYSFVWSLLGYVVCIMRKIYSLSFINKDGLKLVACIMILLSSNITEFQPRKANKNLGLQHHLRLVVTESNQLSLETDQCNWIYYLPYARITKYA